MFAACDKKAPPPPPTASTTAHGVPPALARSGLAHWALAQAAESKQLSEELLAALAKDPKNAPAVYLRLRRSVAALTPMARTYSAMGSVVLLGPKRSVNEAGGALLLLDDALDRYARPGGEDALAEAVDHATQVQRALVIVEQEFIHATISAATGAVALSDAAYDLGLVILEATPTVPVSGDGTLEDARGTLDGVVRGTEAMAREGDTTSASSAALARLAAAEILLRQALDGAKAALDLQGRAALVLGTAELGVAVRLVGESLGAKVRLPYPARTPTRDNGVTEPISALTLPAPRRAKTEQDARMPEIGRRLFTDPRLSGRGDRSCISCHDPRYGYADGRPRADSLDPATSLRNTPTLLYAPIAAAQLWDGRLTSARSQAMGVIRNHAEMALSPAELSSRLQGIDEYREVLADDSGVVSPENVATALVAFQESALVPASAPIDNLARGDRAALSSEELLGLDLFAGKGRCARCHVPPSFGGSRPLDFAVPVYAVLGVPTSPTSKVLDPDRGRALASRIPLDEHAFKTPTLRNVTKTGPYFHNGAYPSLDEVLTFYNDGGGSGLGIDVPNQDPDVTPLKLTKEELRLMKLFLERSLLDAIPLTSLLDPR